MLRKSRRIATANLDVVYGGSKTREEKRRIFVASCDHAALVFVDYFWFSHKTRDRIRQYCRAGDEVMEQWISGAFPGMMVTAHLGNWEVGGQYCASRGRSIWSVYRPIGSKKTLKALLRFRGATGQKSIPREGAMIGMLKALRSNSLIAIVLDQHVELVDGGIYLDFFGLPASFSNAVGLLAHRMKTPICVACAKHDKTDDNYAMKSYKVISAEEAGRLDPEKITAKIVSALAEMILDNPEQWLWAYRRWKRYRPGDDPLKFPFYAKPDYYLPDSSSHPVAGIG